MNRKQTLLFPESVDDYIEEDNPVQFVDVFVDSLDLRELRFKYSQPESTGRPPYNPADMLKLYLYGTIKRGFDQGYMLTRGIEKVGTEISLSILAYNIKRTINIVGVRKLITYLRQKSSLLNGVRITGTTTQTGKMAPLGTIFSVYPDRRVWIN